MGGYNMKMISKAVCIFTAICMIAAFNGACSSTAPETGANSGAAMLRKYNLDVLTAGTAPPDNETVMKEISQVSEKELNINLNVSYVPWSGYMDKVNLMAASGDKFDIFLCFLGELQGVISRKQAMPLDSYMDRYGADLRRVIDGRDWEDVTIGGKIYGIPSVYASIGLPALIYREDLAEKYGMGKLYTLQDIERYMEAITENEKGMVAY